MSDERDTVADRIVARVRRREAEGLAEYGERVEDSDVDRMEELLDELVDALFYGEDEIQRRADLEAEVARLRADNDDMRLRRDDLRGDLATAVGLLKPHRRQFTPAGRDFLDRAIKRLEADDD